MVGATGFEPATPCSQSRCATKLRHAPTRREFTGVGYVRLALLDFVPMMKTPIGSPILTGFIL